MAEVKKTAAEKPVVKKEVANKPKTPVGSAKKLITVKNYTKRFKEFLAVDDLSFSVSEGAIHGFIGPNGAGKTTTIKALIGAYRPTEGEITILTRDPETGEDVPYGWGTKEAKVEIGYIPERASFPKDLNCLEYLQLMATLNGLNSKAAIAKAWELLKQTGLEKHALRKPYDFSSGMKKKVLIAQALMNDPRVLILDEPAANLDPTARTELFNQLIALRNQGKSCFISSHILSELQEIVDEVTIIFQGKIRYTGSASFVSDKFDFRLRTSDDAKAIKVIGTCGVKAKMDDKKFINFETEKEANVHKIIAALAKENILINDMRNLSSDLSAVYDRMAIEFGTVSGVGNEEGGK